MLSDLRREICWFSFLDPHVRISCYRTGAQSQEEPSRESYHRITTFISFLSSFSTQVSIPRHDARCKGESEQMESFSSKKKGFLRDTNS